MAATKTKRKSKSRKEVPANPASLKDSPGLRLEWRTAAELADNPANWRTHPKEQLSALRDVIDDVGWAGVVLFNQRTNRLIDGHARKEIAKPDERLPVLVGDWSEEQERTILATLDPLAAMATTNKEKLAELMKGVRASTDNVKTMLEGLAQKNGVGFGLPEAGDGGDEFDCTPADSGPTRAQSGDLWLIRGNGLEHRLLVGDCTDKANVTRLMGGYRVDISFTSPPYNAGTNALGGNKSMVASKYLNGQDEKDPKEWQQLMELFTAAALSFCDLLIVNVQMLANNKRSIVAWLNNYAEHLADVAIWSKPSAPPQAARSVMNSAFEFIVMLSPEKNPSRAVPHSSFHGNIWNVHNGTGASSENVAPEIHAATMPLHVPTWIIGEVCNESKSVFDPFMGTGTTLIAAHRLGRRCFGCEIEPRYADVILRRCEAEGLTVEKSAT